MAFLTRCPFSLCRRPKRVDTQRMTDGAFPIVLCPACAVAFAAWPDENGIALAIEMPPLSR